MDKQPKALELAAVLDAPEEHYPGNFDTPQRANAMLLCLAQEAADELRRLHEVNAELVEELRNIASAKPREWDAEVRDQFQQWAQNRARAAIAKATGEQQ